MSFCEIKCEVLEYVGYDLAKRNRASEIDVNPTSRCPAGSLSICRSGMPMILIEGWNDFGSITMRIACTPRSPATRHLKPLAKPPTAVLTSPKCSGNLIAAGCTIYP